MDCLEPTTAPSSSPSCGTSTSHSTGGASSCLSPIGDSSESSMQTVGWHDQDNSGLSTANAVRSRGPHYMPEDGIYGDGPNMLDVYFRLFYLTDQEPLSAVRHVAIKYCDRFDCYKMTRTVAVAILLDDAMCETKYLEHIWEYNNRFLDGYPGFEMYFTRRHNFHYIGSGLPFPDSHWSKPLEATVGPPEGYVPKRCWPPLPLLKRLPVFESGCLFFRDYYLRGKIKGNVPWFAYVHTGCVNRPLKDCTLTHEELEDNYWDMLGIRPSQTSLFPAAATAQ